MQRDEAFRWTTDGGMVGLGALPLPSPPPSSIAFDVSHDGSIVVGRSGSDPFEAFRWTAGGGMTGLGVLPGEPVSAPQSFAWSTSADGSVVVGQSGGLTRAFRWTAADGMVPLGGPPYSSAMDVSADGNVIVGSIEITSQQMFRWTSQSGIIQLGPGIANAVSTDGSIIAVSTALKRFAGQRRAELFV
jgi:probable HAF family extracellular repeat protein